MADPDTVNPHNFSVDKIVYNLNGFSVAWGVWEDDTHRLAMRWNGTDTDAGYPKTFGNPVWFLIPQDLSFSLLKAIEEIPASHRVKK